MKIFDKNVNIELCPATVARVDTYARSGIFADNRFLFSMNALYNNIVFQMQETGKTLPLEVTGIQLPLYNKQQVDIIRANNFIIGYIDVKQEEYYYITNDFCKVAGIKFLGLFTWLIIALGIFMTLTFVKDGYAAMFSCMLIITAWCAHVIIKSSLNKKIEKAIDESMKNFSADNYSEFMLPELFEVL